MMQKKRILFLSRLYHPHIGGVEKHVKEISKLLLKNGYEVTIITERVDKNLPVYEILDGIYVHRLTVGKYEYNKKFWIWKWMFFHRSLLLKADIIHIHDVFFWILPFRIFIPFKKVYMTFHGYEGYPVKKGWIIQRKLAEILTNGNICVGDFMKKWYKTRPTSVIYGGVRLRSKNIKPNPSGAVFFGRLDEQTGILEYLKAYSIIKKTNPQFSLIVVGEGKLRAKIPPDVRVVGFQNDIFPYIIKSRIIFVSRYLSMLEALVLGKEVVSTYDNPIKKDYLFMSPFRKYIHIGKDANEIASIVTDLLIRKISSSQLKEGSKWAKVQTWERVIEVYTSLWNSKK